MDKAKRNDPCPCGSGKKYKKCCGAPSKKRTLNASRLPSSGFQIPSAIQSTGASLKGRVTIGGTSPASQESQTGSQEVSTDDASQDES